MGGRRHERSTETQNSGKRELERKGQVEGVEDQQKSVDPICSCHANITKADLGVHPHLQANRSLEP